MRSLMGFGLLLCLGILGVVNATLNPIVIKGNAFFDSVTNDRFYIRGVDYQPGGSSAVNYDPLADTTMCQLNIPYMQQLGLNAIRVYSVDNSADHRECMALLDQAGIYLILDVNTPTDSLNRDDPADSYNAVYLQHVFATIDAFKSYDNLLGFFSGNEVINDVNTTGASTWVKATTRDMKAYIAKQSPRTIPVGYSAADIVQNRLLLAEYLNCGDASERIDFYAFNSYEWCGNSSFTQSGYDQLVSLFSNYSAPLFFSEFGCNLVEPREFTEVGSIYSTQMTGVFSGGCVYEWSQEVSDYGLVDLGTNGSITLLTDYYNLKSEFAQTPMPSGDGDYKATGSASNCPGNSSDFTGWAVLPAIPSAAQVYINNGAGEALGYNGPSNQGLGPDATGVPAGTNTATGTSCPSCSLSGSSSSTAKSDAHMLLVTERGVAGGAMLAAVAAIIGAMLVL